MRVLCCGCHFDDIEIGMGGTALQHVKNGDEVFLVVTSADEWRTGKSTDRLQEQKKAMAILGVKDKHNLMVLNGNDELPMIIRYLDTVKPDLVYLHWPKDTHQDHIRASMIGQAVGRKRHISTLFFDSHSAIDFNPSLFVPIDFEAKLSLLKCFKSQCLPYDRIRLHNAYLASRIGFSGYAEGFIPGRYVLNHQSKGGKRR